MLSLAVAGGRADVDGWTGRYNEPKECDPDTEDCAEKTSSWGRFQNRSRESRGFDIDAKVQVLATPHSRPSQSRIRVHRRHRRSLKRRSELLAVCYRPTSLPSANSLRCRRR